MCAHELVTSTLDLASQSTHINPNQCEPILEGWFIIHWYSLLIKHQTLLMKQSKSMNTFDHRCVHTVLGLTITRQRSHCNSSGKSLKENVKAMVRSGTHYWKAADKENARMGKVSSMQFANLRNFEIALHRLEIALSLSWIFEIEHEHATNQFV